MVDRRSSTSSEQDPLYSTGLRTQQASKKWDIFRNHPTEINSRSTVETKWFDRAEILAKILAYIVTFIVVLGCAVISKGTLFFIVSQLSNDTKPYCNKELEINKDFRVNISSVERVAWIWILIFIYWVPQLGTLIRSVRICSFKSYTTPTKLEFFSVLITETLPAIGSSLLVFCILPELDVIKGVMLTNAVCFIPGLLRLLSKDFRKLKYSLDITFDIISCLAQVSAFIVWPLLEENNILWLMPISLLLISCGWWENFVSESSPITIIKNLGKANSTFENKRYFTYIFISMWKAGVFFLTTLIVFWAREGNVSFLFDLFEEAFQSHEVTITEVLPVYLSDKTSFLESNRTTIKTDSMTVIWVFLINIISTYVCYAFGKFACKIMIQGFSYAFPINLSVPTTVSFLIMMCSMFNKDPCKFQGQIPSYLFFKMPPIYFFNDYISHQQPWLWLLWLLSQAWITSHIWKPTCEKLARTEKLFMRPMFDPYLIDQDLAMNRRAKAQKYIENETVEDKETNDTITKIYACGTMWHENKEEMMEFLKSIMRLDRDQSARKIVKKFLKYDIPNYYELETHVLFDDAFLRLSPDDPDPKVNQFVKDLVSSIDKAASEIHQKNINLRPPKKIITPYGGRLVWTLPGQTKMIAHLKDKKKIRAKKRWSQVMYMYYILGHRLMERDDLTKERKDVIAENTYILALDGDIDFQPLAVHLLVDLMKKNKTLGAACGRIHPIGSGAMVWYQMFEYAIGHWFQKATEHMIGCVLCSPGCFSLFRGKALMDDNVMARYTTRATKALHYVQYDQGEDRWLCTLMLQRGYRVEYSAASDAFTHCPEGFNEFYNQRRRWMPSTTANIFDLLMDYKRTVSINDNISKLYIAYQVVLMVGTILGPGTIFLMLVGAFVAAFQMDQWSSFMWNLMPILLYIFISITFTNDKIQLFFAGIISAIYGLVMMAVLVGVMLQISNDGLLAPSSLFFFCVAGEMILGAILHPKEFNCLLYGIIYYVTVPSMYMLLVIYSAFNMNNVSWGTREVTVIKKPEETVEQKQKEEGSMHKVMNILGTVNDDNAGAMEFSFGGIFKCFLCTRKDNFEEQLQLKQIFTSLEKLSQKVEMIEKLQLIDVQDPQAPLKKLKVIEGARAKEVRADTVNKPDPNTKSNTNTNTINTEAIFEEQVESYSWIDDEGLPRGEVKFLSKREENFWTGLLEKYLHPIDDSNEKEAITKELKDLRDKTVFSFFMLNSLFVLVVFLLTLKKDLLHVNWPLDIKYNVTYNDDTKEIEIDRSFLQLEPIGFVFLLFFALLLVIQFIGMLFHRFGTFAQILANTNVNFKICEPTPENLTEEDAMNCDPLEVAFKLQNLKDDDEPEITKEVSRRKTIYQIEDNLNKRDKNITNLHDAFQRRWAKAKQGGDIKLPVKRDTIMQLEARRTTIIRRMSKAVINNALPITTTNNRVSLGIDNPALEDEEV